jgi:hypothetical protein
MRYLREILIMTAFAGLFLGCLPSNLDKYRKDKKSSAADNNSLFHPGADMNSPSPDSSFASKSRNTRDKDARSSKATGGVKGGRATIYALDAQTFRFLLAEKNVWNAAINVLMRNYNLNIVNQNVGVLTTEWDSFYLKNEVYRNKISVRVRRSSYGIVDVTIHNNVEKLRDASQAAGTIGAVWLPAKDEAKEISRLLQNMALVLNQPPPIFPPGMDVAKGLSDGKEITR